MLVAGHLYLAVIHPTTRHALRGMTRGDVREDWAREHHSKWVEAPTAGYNPPVPSFRYVVADVFTDTPLAGNQLAVFTDARGLDDATMQALALEIGFSETVFVLPPGAGRARRGSGSSTRARSCASRGIRRSARHSCSPRRSSSA